MSAPAILCAPAPSVDMMARGWCPGLARPMASGDGLLARIHPPHGCLSPAQALALAEAAHCDGNGLIDITSHANLQIRGVRAQTHADLRARLAPVGLDDENRRAPFRATVLSPLAGLDASELVNGRTLADAVEVIARAVVLPPKFLIVVDSGGLFPLGHLSPDLKLLATAPGLVRIILSGQPALCTQPLPLERLLADFPRLLETLAATLAQTGVRRVRMLTGNARRAAFVMAGLAERREASGGCGSTRLQTQVDDTRPPPFAPAAAFGHAAIRPISFPPGSGDALPARQSLSLRADASHAFGVAPSAAYPMRTRFSTGDDADHHRPASAFVNDMSSIPAVSGHGPGVPAPQPMPPRAGAVQLKDGTAALFAVPPFGQMSARALEGLAHLAEDIGLAEIRLTPLRGIMLPGLPISRLAHVCARLAALGFIITPDDSRLRILTCAGAPACSRALCNSHALASLLAAHIRHIPEGEDDIHLSACLKGCARRGPSALTLVAMGSDFAVIPDGGPLDTPALRLPFADILNRLSTLPAGRAMREAFAKDDAN